MKSLPDKIHIPGSMSDDEINIYNIAEAVNGIIDYLTTAPAPDSAAEVCQVCGQPMCYCITSPITGKTLTPSYCPTHGTGKRPAGGEG